MQGPSHRGISLLMLCMAFGSFLDSDVSTSDAEPWPPNCHCCLPNHNVIARQHKHHIRSTCRMSTMGMSTQRRSGWLPC